MSTETTQLIYNINSKIIAPIILLLFSLSLVVFFWGIVDFIRGSDNETVRQIGKDHMIWGIIGIFIMVSAWGIILVAINTFGIEVPAFPMEIFQ